MTTQNEALKGKNFPVLSSFSERLPDYEVNFRFYPGFAFPCLLLILKFVFRHIFVQMGKMPSFVLVICVFLLVFFIATSSVADAPKSSAFHFVLF